jgi:ribonucleoside-triphosphate reductase (formate)
MTAKYGLPYFQNFINSELSPNMVRSMCCRLQLDLRELLKRGNGLFGSAEQTGSLGVVTINCARLGFAHRGDEAGLLRQLDRLLDLARNSLEIKRKVIQRHMDAGLFPYTKRYLGTLRNHFSTIGVNGINEMIRNFTADREDITTEPGQALACRLLDHVRQSACVSFRRPPATSTTWRPPPRRAPPTASPARTRSASPASSRRGPGGALLHQQLPAPGGLHGRPLRGAGMQETLQSKYTGGTVLHLYMSEQIGSVEACKRLVRRALTNFRVPYITVTPVFSICPRHGYIAGEHEFCPVCDQELIARKQAQSGLAACESRPQRSTHEG